MSVFIVGIALLLLLVLVGLAVGIVFVMRYRSASRGPKAEAFAEENRRLREENERLKGGQ